MNDLLAGLLSALVATNTPQAVSNLVQQKTGVSVRIPDPNDPAEKAYQKVLAEDDRAVEEITRWRNESEKAGTKPDEIENGLLSNRIRQRAAPIRQAYDVFLQQYPKHVNGRIAYGAFLAEIGEETEGARQLEKAVEADGQSAAALNNLANYYGHNGRVREAFSLYDRAMRAEPREALYCENLATTVFLFRKDAMAHYQLSEAEVFGKAIGLYRKAVELDPLNFDRAVELAKTYYGVRLPETDDASARRQAALKLADEAIAAWEGAYKIAPGDDERQGVRLHYARWHINAGRLDLARQQLEAVTSEAFSAGKTTLLKRLERLSSETNAPPPLPAPAADPPKP
jgi:pentatricopeptide repeat protein